MKKVDRWRRRASGILTGLEQDRGAAMIFVLCLMALVLALGLSALYAASLTVTETSRRRERQQCYEQALTFSEYLQTLLPGEEDEEFQETSFYQNVEAFLDGDQEYSIADYSMQSPPEDEHYGMVSISLEKEQLMEPDNVLLEEGVSYLDQELHITVKVTLGDSMCSLTSVYYRQLTQEEGERVSQFLYQRREKP